MEEEIDRVRGEIESMEADQKTLEHCVDFATLDLQLTEQYKEQFNPQPTSVSGSMHNAFVAGLRHATGGLLRIVLFLEKFGACSADLGGDHWGSSSFRSATLPQGLRQGLEASSKTDHTIGRASRSGGICAERDAYVYCQARLTPAVTRISLAFHAFRL